MNFEPGPVEPLDEAYYARILAPSDEGDATTPAIDASGGLAAAARGLDDAYGRMLEAPARPPDEAAIEGLLAIGTAASLAVDQGTGLPDESVNSAVDGVGEVAGALHTDMVDAPSIEEAVNQVLPWGYVAPFDYLGLGIDFDSLTPEQQAAVNNFPGGDLSQLPEPGTRGGGNG